MSDITQGPNDTTAAEAWLLTAATEACLLTAATPALPRPAAVGTGKENGPG
ncbi:hypothetical protein [Streptomyces sp. SID1121]|uniref:hypothetical protein n=1 Tax=Streptomyces sp. SID1121 TaxID=3425888 RepID=UPI004057958F